MIGKRPREERGAGREHEARNSGASTHGERKQPGERSSENRAGKEAWEEGNEGKENAQGSMVSSTSMYSSATAIASGSIDVAGRKLRRTAK